MTGINRKVWFVISLAVFLFLMTRPVKAYPEMSSNMNTTIPAGQISTPSIQRLRIQVMPEYDDPRILVVVQGRLRGSAADFPQLLMVRIPAEAQINQMAVLDIDTAGAGPGVPRGQQAGGGLIAKPYQAMPDPLYPEWMLVTYELDNAHFFYEYYLAAPAGTINRSFTFTLFPTQHVETAQLEVQQPLTATQFQITPPATTTYQDEETGFTYHLMGIGPVTANEAVAVQISYVKLDDDPSINRTAGLGDSGDGLGSLTGFLAKPGLSTGIILGIFLVGVVLIISAGMLLRRYWSADSGRKNKPVGRFCPGCAAHLQETDTFCPHCGLAVA